jgi:hypothetical protein
MKISGKKIALPLALILALALYPWPLPLTLALSSVFAFILSRSLFIISPHPWFSPLALYRYLTLDLGP